MSALLDCPLPELAVGPDGVPRIPRQVRTSWHLAQWMIEQHAKRLRPAASEPPLRDRRFYFFPKMFARLSRPPRTRPADEVARLTDEAIWDELVELLVRVLRVERSAVTPPARLAKDLGFS